MLDFGNGWFCLVYTYYWIGLVEELQHRIQYRPYWMSTLSDVEM